MSSEKDIYLFLSSKDSANIYINNDSADYTVQLQNVVTLDGEWSCTLVDFYCELESPAHFYIMTDIIQDSYAKDMKLPILQCIYNSDDRSKKIRFNSDTTITLPVNQSSIHSIRIHIRQMTDLKLVKTVSDSVSHCVLKLTKT